MIDKLLQYFMNLMLSIFTAILLVVAALGLLLLAFITPFKGLVGLFDRDNIECKFKGKDE